MVIPAEISQFALFGWFEWVAMFRDTAITYRDDKTVLGRDLGPVMDICPAMTYRSTVRGLTNDERVDEAHKQERKRFNKSLERALGDSFKYEDFVSDPELEDRGTPDQSSREQAIFQTNSQAWDRNSQDL